jgi:hypothetical protein
MTFGANGLYVDDVSIHLPIAIDQRTDIGNHGLDPRAMPLAAFHLHINDHQTRRTGRQFQIVFALHREISFSLRSFLFAKR